MTAVMVATVVAWAVGGHGRGAPTRGSAPVSARTAGATGTAGTTAGGGTTSGTSDTPTTGTAPPTTAAPAHGPYAVGTASLTLTTGEGGLPTSLWYPASRAGPGAPARGRAGGWPLIVFSQGFGVGPQAYSDLLSAWAAGGFVVAAPAYPFVTEGIDEGDIVNHPADLRSVVDELVADGSASSSMPLLRGLIEDRVGLVGHSDGGDVTDAAVANSCCTIPGVVAAEVLSGAELKTFGGAYGVRPGIPVLVVQGDADTISPPACSEQIYDAATGTRYYLDLLGAGHLDPYLDPAALAAFPTTVPDPNAAKAPLYRRVVERTTLAFWDRYLAGASTGDGLRAPGNVPGVSSLTAGPPVAVSGTCQGSPAG
ncbi:MAG: alpha/beta hydrolase family protein [Acidimicrobiales bacterium]